MLSEWSVPKDDISNTVLKSVPNTFISEYRYHHDANKNVFVFVRSLKQHPRRFHAAASSIDVITCRLYAHNFQC